MAERNLAEALDLRHSGLCLICGTTASVLGTTEPTRTDARKYSVARCDNCGFCFVMEPRTDFENLYTEAYYRGKGFDPLVSYSIDEQPTSVRHYEWSGIAQVVAGLLGSTPSCWLDYGCGYGGLVRYVEHHAKAAEILGFDVGHPLEHAAASGISVLDEEGLARSRGRFDVVTAVEVLEHVIDPLQTLHQLAGLLTPGGVLFITTGNAERHRKNLLDWPYLIPQIHISLYEPRTLEHAYQAVGLTPIAVGRSAGMTEIIKYKVLKNLRFRRQSPLMALLPWRVFTRIADRREGVSSQPAAVRPITPHQAV